jgi:hypothetical protein
MQLVRLALLTLGEPPGKLLGMTLASKAAQIGPLRRTVVDKTFLLESVTSLEHRPKKTGSGLIVIPEKPRIMLEEGIEHYSNLLSVAIHSERTISSPHPSIALVPEDEADKQLLDGARGILRDAGNRAVPGTKFSFDLMECINELADRMDGMAILAEALCHKHQTGRFHELVRLYERAFALAGRRLIEPMSTFLAGAEQGYVIDEIANRIDMRDGATHADQRNEILFEGDVAWVGPRMMQAAYDILLNKSRWRSAETARRDIWKPIQGTLSSAGDMFATRGEDWTMTYQIFDEFKRFPFNLNGNLKQLRSEWWTGQFLLEGTTINNP